MPIDRQELIGETTVPQIVPAPRAVVGALLWEIPGSLQKEGQFIHLIARHIIDRDRHRATSGNGSLLRRSASPQHIAAG